MFNNVQSANEVSGGETITMLDDHDGFLEMGKELGCRQARRNIHRVVKKARERVHHVLLLLVQVTRMETSQ